MHSQRTYIVVRMERVLGAHHVTGSERSARGRGPVLRSGSLHRVYLCCAARTELK